MFGPAMAQKFAASAKIFSPAHTASQLPILTLGVVMPSMTAEVLLPKLEELLALSTEWGLGANMAGLASTVQITADGTTKVRPLTVLPAHNPHCVSGPTRTGLRAHLVVQHTMAGCALSTGAVAKETALDRLVRGLSPTGMTAGSCLTVRMLWLLIIVFILPSNSYTCR